MAAEALFKARVLHGRFIAALGDSCLSHSDPRVKPLDLDLKPPLPTRVRLYLYSATNPPGGRGTAEYKIQLIVPGQWRGQKGNFDMGGGRFVILAGYASDLDVFILWDASLYNDFAYSRNVQVREKTVLEALLQGMAVQERRLRTANELVIAARADRLWQALRLRWKYALERLAR